jgi:predicted nucleic acid-binding protein
VEGKAAYIITGDRHLLDLRVYKEIEIIRPAEFLRILEMYSP